MAFYLVQLFETYSFAVYRSMAQKESSHQEIVDTINTELTQVRRQYEELQVLSRDQVRI